jgi:hypothetical protein
MPWVDPEITQVDLIEAVVRGYFYAIVTGALSVTVETPEKPVTIDDTTLDEIALTLDEAERKDVLNLVDLGYWASTRKPQDILKLAPCDPDRPDWTNDLIPADQIKPLRKSLENGNKLAVRASLNIRVAYDTRRGNPLRRYNPADFRLNQTPIRLEPPPNGIKVVTNEENRMTIEVLNPDFCLTVIGFDEKRDLLVDVKMEEGPDDSQI